METYPVSQTDTHPIRKGRARHKLTQGALGRVVGVTKATVCKWEQGKALPEPAVAMAVAKRLRISLEDVYASARTN